MSSNGFSRFAIRSTARKNVLDWDLGRSSLLDTFPHPREMDSTMLGKASTTAARENVTNVQFWDALYERARNLMVENSMMHNLGGHDGGVYGAGGMHGGNNNQMMMKNSSSLNSIDPRDVTLFVNGLSKIYTLRARYDMIPFKAIFIRKIQFFNSLYLSMMLSALGKSNCILTYQEKSIVRDEIRGRMAEFSTELSMLMNALSKLGIKDENLWKELSQHTQHKMAIDPFHIRDLAVIATSVARVMSTSSSSSNVRSLSSSSSCSSSSFSSSSSSSIYYHHSSTSPYGNTTTLSNNSTTIVEASLFAKIAQQARATVGEATPLEIARILQAFAVTRNANVKQNVDFLRYCLTNAGDKLLFHTPAELGTAAFAFGQLLEDITDGGKNSSSSSSSTGMMGVDGSISSPSTVGGSAAKHESLDCKKTVEILRGLFTKIRKYAVSSVHLFEKKDIVAMTVTYARWNLEFPRADLEYFAERGSLLLEKQEEMLREVRQDGVAASGTDQELPLAKKKNKKGMLSQNAYQKDLEESVKLLNSFGLLVNKNNEVEKLTRNDDERRHNETFTKLGLNLFPRICEWIGSVESNAKGSPGGPSKGNPAISPHLTYWETSLHPDILRCLDSLNYLGVFEDEGNLKKIMAIVEKKILMEILGARKGLSQQQKKLEKKLLAEKRKEEREKALLNGDATAGIRTTKVMKMEQEIKQAVRIQVEALEVDFDESGGVLNVEEKQATTPNEGAMTRPVSSAADVTVDSTPVFAAGSTPVTVADPTADLTAIKSGESISVGKEESISVGKEESISSKTSTTVAPSATESPVCSPSESPPTTISNLIDVVSRSRYCVYFKRAGYDPNGDLLGMLE